MNVKRIRSLDDLPHDDIHTDPLRVLINVWRRRNDPVHYNVADELCAILNGLDNLKYAQDCHHEYKYNESLKGNFCIHCNECKPGETCYDD